MAMTRNQRRNAKRMRDAINAAKEIWQEIDEATAKRRAACPKGHSPKGMGNRNVYTGSWGHIAIGGHRRMYSTPNDQVKGKR